jgi:hypothetical protein
MGWAGAGRAGRTIFLVAQASLEVASIANRRNSNYEMLISKKGREN